MARSEQGALKRTVSVGCSKGTVCMRKGWVAPQTEWAGNHGEARDFGPRRAVPRVRPSHITREVLASRAPLSRRPSITLVRRDDPAGSPVRHVSQRPKD